jgi:hypothetical protein
MSRGWFYTQPLSADSRHHPAWGPATASGHRPKTWHRGYLGVTIQDVSPDLADQFQLKSSGAAVVADVKPECPTAKVGDDASSPPLPTVNDISPRRVGQHPISPAGYPAYDNARSPPSGLPSCSGWAEKDDCLFDGGFDRKHNRDDLCYRISGNSMATNSPL